MTRRKVCAVITSRVHYARSVKLLALLRDHPGIELQIVVGGSALLPKYGEVASALERDGFRIDERLYNLVEGGNHVAMAKTAGLSLLEFATAFERLDPDIVLIRGDRFEKLAAATAAAYLNKTIAHIEGGDVTGSIDESVRHAITKLAHVHFTTNDESRDRVLRMGEDPAYVFVPGSLDVEYAASAPAMARAGLEEAIRPHGIGADIALDRPYLIVLQHPVTSEDRASHEPKGSTQYEHALRTIEAVDTSGMPTLWFWPNIDAGTDAVSKGIRSYREARAPKHIRFLRHLDPAIFINLLRGSACIVGNSSAGIKECSYLGIPAVDIGPRQAGRRTLANVMHVGYDTADIRSAIAAQVAHGPYPSDPFYYRPGASERVVDLLASLPLYTQKRFYEGHAR